MQSVNTRSKIQAAFKRDDKAWFQEYSDFVRSGSILKLGYGLGYVTALVKSVNRQVTSLEVNHHAQALPDSSIIYYDGAKLPYPDKSFDTIICSMTLHHTIRPRAMLREMERVGRKHIILIDTTAANPYSFAAMIWGCLRANQQAGQASTIYPWSYLTPKRITQWSRALNLKLVHHVVKARARGYSAELWVWRVAQ